MNSRDAILSRIRDALADNPPVDGPPVDEPPVPEVWPRENPDRDTLARRFAEEIEAVQGEVYRCDSTNDARRKLLELADQAGWEEIGAVDRPLAREVASDLPTDRVTWATTDWQPNQMAQLSAGLVEADYLLADTGSALVACDTPQSRLLCYLPPACVVVARADQLVEHMPAAWPEIARRTAEPDRRGEFVLITGPSRTADIEKILILGVHGPKRVVVLLIEA